jgi:hypothetical protein
MPGSDTEMHQYSVRHSGIATITKVSSNDNEIYINFFWKTENDKGDPLMVSHVNTRDIEGLAHPDQLKIDGRFFGECVYFMKQRGSTTPQIVKSSWTYRGVLRSVDYEPAK